MPAAQARGPWVVVAVVGAACVAASMTFPIYDPDLWQHLAAGRFVWQTHQLPDTQIWSWPTYGAPNVMPSWAFRVLLWPFWSTGEVTGIFVWRWFTALATFAVLWAAARSMGARGPVAVLVLVIAALIWRQRSMARPETLAAILLAVEVLILETRRNGNRDRSAWIVLILWLWVQVHVSFVYGFLILAVYALADLAPRRARVKAPTLVPHRFRLPLVLVVAAAIAFVNPYGARLVLQPLEFFLHERHEPLYRTIDELRPPFWNVNVSNGLPLFLVAWPLLALGRVFGRRLDGVELVLCAVFTWAALGAQRFVGFYALVAAPFIARDLEAWWVRNPRPGGVLEWKSALVVGAACVLACIPEWLRPSPRFGIGLDLRSLPVAACDFMAAHEVRGRGFNYFYHGGYVLWRFGLERDRLPFMDIHQAGTPAIRQSYLLAFGNRQAWHGLSDTHRFDWLLLRRTPAAGDSVLDFADADTTYALVFLDDAAALFVRRAGSLATVADSFAFHHVPAGNVALGPLGIAVERDSALRATVRAELDRARASSARHARISSLLANVAMIEGRFADARALLLEARAIAPETPLVRERLAIIARQDSTAVRRERGPG